MRFPQVQERLQAAVFARLGEPATWQGTADPVRVRRPTDRDEDFRTEYGALVVPGAQLAVRQSEVAEPVDGQQVQLLDDDGAALADGLFVVDGAPKLDRKKGVWICRVKPQLAA